MTDYVIATSSTSDLPRTWLEEHHIPFIAGDRLKTSMINEFVYYDFFKGLLDSGKDVIFLDMSQKMSVSFENANKAAEKIRPEYPEQRLYVMDTRCISGGLGLLVENMVLQKEAGAGWEDVIAWGEENKLKIAHRFTVDDLNYLKAGGRVSNASALVGSLLSIKPVLYVPDRGTLDVAKKVRGRKAALRAIIDGVLHDLSKIDPTGLEFRILQADCRDDAAYVRDEIKKAYPQVGRITITGLGVVIGKTGNAEADVSAFPLSAHHHPRRDSGAVRSAA